MNKILIFLICLLTITVMACSEVNSQNTLEPSAFNAAISAETTPQLIDVRSESEFNDGYIAKAVNWPLNSPTYATGIAKLDKSKPVYVYCLSGGRSASAAKDLESKGFTKVFNLKGGTLAWGNAGLPLSKTSNLPSVVSMTMEEYNQEINSAPLVLVDFYAKWCGPCKKMEPELEKLTKEGKIKVIRVDVDANKELAKSFSITEIPILLCYKKGEKVMTLIGYQTKEMLEAPFKQ